MQLHIFTVDEIAIRKDRQRKVFEPKAVAELAASIADNGLIHPVVVRKNDQGEITLVAGERRLKALDICWNLGQEVRCGQRTIPERSVPCLFLGEIDPIDAFEIELEENIRRTDLDWREKATAVSQLYDLRRMQAERDGKPAPTAKTIAEEVSGTSEGQFGEDVRQDIILARHLANPVVANAGSRKEAFKALKRDEELKRHAELSERLGPIFGAHLHTLLQGDCLEILPKLPGEFDVILTDPPYGIRADEFNDSGGKTAGAHRYEDDYDTWQGLIRPLAEQLSRLAKPAAHLYVFCDVDRFHELKMTFELAGWKCFRTPLIWVNPSAMRAPWPEHGPQRKWQMILYGVRGNRTVTRLYSDVVAYPGDDNLGHQAQKPVPLFIDLLRRSIRPGDTVLDPFCGTGTIFPAAHELKCKATGIEIDPAAYGIAATRLKGLK